MNIVISACAIAALSLDALPQPARAQRTTDSPKETVSLTSTRKPQGFSVVLVLGDLQGGTTQDNVPPAARKALTDMREFLPYKSYRLLDVQWTLCCGGGRGPTPVVSRLRGPDGNDFELTLAASLEPASRLAVRFALRDPSSADGEGGGSELIRELQAEKQRLEAQYEAMRKRAQQNYEVGMGKGPDEEKEVLEARARLAQGSIKLAEAKQRRSVGRVMSSASRAMIDTSFTMDVGETVVVGTSRLAGGDKALIALAHGRPAQRNHHQVAARTVQGSDPSRRITHRSQKVRHCVLYGVRPQSLVYPLRCRTGC